MGTEAFHPTSVLIALIVVHYAEGLMRTVFFIGRFTVFSLGAVFCQWSVTTNMHVMIKFLACSRRAASLRFATASFHSQLPTWLG